MATQAAALRNSALAEVRGSLVDRHLLPKAAFVILLLVSLWGTSITMGTHGAPWPVVLLRWGYFVLLAVAAGGGLWWSAFVRLEADAGDPEAVEAFAEREAERYRRLLRATAVGLAGTAPHLAFFGGRPGPGGTLAGAQALLLTALLAVAASLTICARHRARTWRDRRRWAVFGLGVALLAAGAVGDAVLQSPGALGAAALRSLHVVAFGLWLGGAAWNLAVALPAVRRDPRVPVVVAAAHQLERFRWVVRMVLPTLAVTGVLQAVPYAGGSLGYLLGSWAGGLILLKAAALVVLVGIFVTCPLWRACSPVRGMCNLEDLHPVWIPTQRLDNRGKPCAGFVHVRRALEAMRPGEVLEVLSTDPVSWWELPAWARQNGYELLDQRPWGRYRLLWRAFRFLLRKPGVAGTGAGEAGG